MATTRRLLSSTPASSTVIRSIRENQSVTTQHLRVMRYRPDIDGLRALAVISVVLFHSGLNGIAGGFVGVDVFFVISGYLIGGQIFREAAGGEFSFAAFYARRLRRILPALLALILSLLLLGLFLLTPPELRELGKEAVATVSGTSNLLFYTGGGYFGPTAEDSPLLMTWSLGIEEQFYLIFPILALALVRQHLIPPRLALLAFSILSFAASVLLTDANPQAAFYLLPTRGWELALGVLLALQELRSPALPRKAEQTTSFAGLSLIAVAIFGYRPDIPFPGVYALLPTIGAVLLIASPNATIGRVILAHPVPRFLGKISYSWYLWHWPLFYLNRTLAEGDSALHPAILIIASLAVGYASWALIEQPFRRRILAKNVVLRRYATVSGMVVFAALVLYRTNGWPQRLDDQEERFTRRANSAREDACLAPYGATAPVNVQLCLPPQTVSADRLLLLGDSHSSATSAGIRRLAKANSLAFGQMTKTSCPPLMGYVSSPEIRPGHWQECWRYQRSVFDYLRRTGDVRTVVLVGYWSSDMMLGSDPRNGGKATIALRLALERTIRRLLAMGKQVVLLQDVPSFRFDPYARVIGSSMPWRSRVRAMLRREEVNERFAGPAEIRSDPAREVLRTLAARYPAVILIDPAAHLCDGSGCRISAPDKLFYYDLQHLTPDGALVALPAMSLRQAPRSIGISLRNSALQVRPTH